MLGRDGSPEGDEQHDAAADAAADAPELVELVRAGWSICHVRLKPWIRVWRLAPLRVLAPEVKGKRTWEN